MLRLPVHTFVHPVVQDALYGGPSSSSLGDDVNKLVLLRDKWGRQGLINYILPSCGVQVNFLS